MVEIRCNENDFDYRREEGVNQSSLKAILKSPAHYQAALKNRLIPTPAMEMGTALHCLLLDGKEAFDAQYVRKPDGIKLSTTEGRQWKESIGRKKVLSTGGKDDPWGSVLGMAAELGKLAWFDYEQKDYIKNNEVSIYWEDHGVKCKGRLDRVLLEQGILLDLKSTDTVDSELFQKKVVGLGYDFQAAYYTRAAEKAYDRPFRFIFAAVERKAPFTVDLFEVSPDMMAEGMFKVDKALALYAECESSGEWPNREPRVYDLDYPNWYNSVRAEESQEEEHVF